MSSLTLTLNGDSSELSANYFPPIVLDPNAEYVCGLVDFQTFNSIPNINESNNRLYFMRKDTVKIPTGLKRANLIVKEIAEIIAKPGIVIDGSNYMEFIKIDFKQFKYVNTRDLFHNVIREYNLTGGDYMGPDYFSVINTEDLFYFFRDDDDGCPGCQVQCEYLTYIEIPTGTYELDDIISSLNAELAELKMDYSGDERLKIEVVLNKNTLTTEIRSNTYIDLRHEKSIGYVFGFKDSHVLAPNVIHKSDNVVKISTVNAIKIECNIVAGAYCNGKLGHTIHEFYPSVGAGFKIIEVPQNVIYLPLTVHSIDNLTIRCVDQDNKLVDFRGETITLRIHIKKN